MDIYSVTNTDEIVAVRDINAFDWSKEKYRVSSLLLRNSSNEILLAQRQFSKEHSPGCWGSSAAGILEEGETYESNVLKETQEEIGLTLHRDELTIGPKYIARTEHPDRQYFIQWYFAHSDITVDECILQEDEVAAVRWFTLDAFERELKENPEKFVDITLEVFKEALQ